MTHTELIDYIIIRLEKEGFSWLNEKELFEKIVFPLSMAKWKKKYRAKWSSWRWKRRNKLVGIEYLYKSRPILQIIAKNFNFDMSLWEENNSIQEKTVKLAVKKILNKNSKIDLSFLIKTEPKITAPQQELLTKLNSQSKSAIERLINQNSIFFSEKKDNQAFFLKALLILYKKSYFEILYQKILPSLFMKHKNKFEVLKIEADVLTNLKNPNYDKIIDLLDTVECNSPKETADIKTMIISNLKRLQMNNTNITQQNLEKLLLSFSEYYYQIYKAIRPYDYYPAINLAYMVTLYKIISSSHLEIDSYDLEKIYKQVKSESIKIDNRSKKKDLRYYATITDFEFRLLLGSRGVEADINIMLDDLEPPVRLIEQTLGQMRWFLEIAQRFDKRGICFNEFVGVVELLEGYKNAK